MNENETFFFTIIYFYMLIHKEQQTLFLKRNMLLRTFCALQNNDQRHEHRENEIRGGEKF